MYCPQCGRPNEPGATFCVSCGTALPKPMTPPPPPGPTPAKLEQRRSSPWSIVVGVLVVVLLILCCCCGLIAGAAPLLFVYLSPTPTSTPTATLPPTYTPRPTVRPTEMRATPSLRTPSPSPTVPGVTGGMKTYSNTAYGYSLQYPTDWFEQQASGGPIFCSLKTGACAGVTVAVGASALGGEDYVMNLSISAFQRTYTNATVTSRSSKTLNGLTWQYVVMTGDYQGKTKKTDIYVRVHTNGNGYVFLGISTPTNYDQDTLEFAQIMESFRFLP